MPQVVEFKYLGVLVLFMSEGRMKCETDRWVGAAAAVMWRMYWSVMVKRELRQKAFHLPVNLCSHSTVVVELWVKTKRTISCSKLKMRMPPCGGVLGICHELEALGKTRDTLEGQRLLAGLGESSSL